MANGGKKKSRKRILIKIATMATKFFFRISFLFFTTRQRILIDNITSCQQTTNNFIKAQVPKAEREFLPRLCYSIRRLLSLLFPFCASILASSYLRDSIIFFDELISRTYSAKTRKQTRNRDQSDNKSKFY